MTSNKELAVRNSVLKTYPSGASFINKFNFDYCMSEFKANSYSAALRINVLKLREIASAYNEDTPKILIEAWLVNFSTFIGVEITSQQCRETAGFLYEEGYMLNLAELTFFFKRLKKGYYGKFYGKFDGMSIISACRTYRMERGKLIASMSEAERKLI